MTNPTPRQVQALYHVQAFTEVHGRAPSYRELAGMLGAEVKNTWRVMHYAQKKGLVRGLALTDAGLSAVVPLLGG